MSTVGGTISKQLTLRMTPSQMRSLSVASTRNGCVRMWNKHRPLARSLAGNKKTSHSTVEKSKSETLTVWLFPEETAHLHADKALQ
jgi:hypothetical protein